MTGKHVKADGSKNRVLVQDLGLQWCLSPRLTSLSLLIVLLDGKEANDVAVELLDFWGSFSGLAQHCLSVLLTWSLPI